MSKEQYLTELRDKLRGLRIEEIEDALSYCEEYFEEAGIENEQIVIEELGNPTKYAALIRAESAIRENQKEIRKDNGDKNPKTSMKNMITIFLGICAIPLAFPLVLVAVCLIFSFIIVILALAFAAVVSAAAVFIAGIPLIFSGFTNLATPGNALIAFGGGLLSIGIALLLMLGLIRLIGVLMPAFLRMITYLYDKAKGGKRNEKV